MLYRILFLILLAVHGNLPQKIDPNLTEVWGPGLKPDKITMPARYFFIQAKTTDTNNVNSSAGNAFEVTFQGLTTKSLKPCRIWTNILDRNDGSYIVRYKMYEPCTDVKINIYYNKTQHVAESPYSLEDMVYSDDCDCPASSVDDFIERWECGVAPPQQIVRDLDRPQFLTVNWNETRLKVIDKYNKPHSISLCHYVIKSNKIYRQCYGKYVGFKMFMDSVLLSLARKTLLPDNEFFVNLGDWPLVAHNIDEELYPIFSWCGSNDTGDIVMPTYEIVESTLENMGRVTLDMLSVQGNTKTQWSQKYPKAFWRGRDSNRHRLDLIEIARQHPHLFNVSLTNFFFFRDEEEVYGPKTEHVSFFSFFNYKYQLALDGTVAAYRFPYLLAGGSLIFKQNSKYYEHFYNELVPGVHYIPVEKDLSDLVDKLNWAINNDEKAEEIARNSRDFVNDNLLPVHIYCYYAHLLNEFSQRISSKIHVLDGMELVEQPKQNDYCDDCRNLGNLIITRKNDEL